MKKAIIGRKVGMTQIFDEAGKVVPVTVIEAGPCVVVQKKTADKEGYNSVQLGFDECSEKKLTKPERGHIEKAGVAPQRHLHEFRLEDCSALNVGDVLKADVFKEGERVDVTGISKGKGFAGVIKRHGAHRLKESHGTGPVHRHAGSMASSTDPSHMIVVRGAIPGPKGGIVYLKNSVKKFVRKGPATPTISTNPQKRSARG